jgi:hypothetical protein
MESVKYRPGSRAPRTGAYTVTHRTHRLSHMVLMDEGEVFPECHKCGKDVRYELYMRIQRLASDRDFTREEDDFERRKVLRFPKPRLG